MPHIPSLTIKAASVKIIKQMPIVWWTKTLCHLLMIRTCKIIRPITFCCPIYSGVPMCSYVFMTGIHSAWRRKSVQGGNLCRSSFRHARCISDLSRQRRSKGAKSSLWHAPFGTKKRGGDTTRKSIWRRSREWSSLYVHICGIKSGGLIHGCRDKERKVIPSSSDACVDITIFLPADC